MLLVEYKLANANVRGKHTPESRLVPGAPKEIRERNHTQACASHSGFRAVQHGTALLVELALPYEQESE